MRQKLRVQLFDERAEIITHTFPTELGKITNRRHIPVL